MAHIETKEKVPQIACFVTRAYTLHKGSCIFGRFFVHCKILADMAIFYLILGTMIIINLYFSFLARNEQKSVF